VHRGQRVRVVVRDGDLDVAVSAGA
jgi:hypothetical protein